LSFVGRLSALGVLLLFQKGWRIAVRLLEALNQDRPVHVSGYQLERKVEIAIKEGTITTEVACYEVVDRPARFLVRPLTYACPKLVQQGANALGRSPTVWRHEALVAGLIHFKAEKLPDHPVSADTD